MNKGKKNKYTCDKCGQSIITVDRDAGVTPFILLCRATKGCTGVSRSRFYRDVAGSPTFEWYRPGGAELSRMSTATQEHIRHGGLLLRPIGEK